MANKIRLADELGGICEVDGCGCKATSIVYSNNRGAVILCCNTHAYNVVNEGDPEYHVTCMNCGCEMPVN